jgi:GTP 3',8-cyclase
MPEDDYVWLARESLLGFDEIGTLVDVFTGLGIDKIRLTGGEPLLRSNLPDLVRILAARPALSDIALTTNATMLAEFVEPLRRAGLRRLNISLDTLRRDRFLALTRQDAHARVIEGIEAAARVFAGTKIDTVVIRGINDDELVPLLDYGGNVGAEVRFIEYMDVGGATHWTSKLVVPRQEMLSRLRSAFGQVSPVDEPDSSAPADRFSLPDGRVFGIISSTTEPFCRRCDRARLAADGVFYTCLYATDGLSLREHVRAGVSRSDLAHLVSCRWAARADRGAEVRHELRNRTTFLPLAVLRADPHLEMHNRGG